MYGPQVRISLPKLRAAIPKKYPDPPLSRHHAQPPVPVPGARLGLAYAVDRGARGHQPAARDEATIFRGWSPETIGFITYSEGCNDDVNKIVWSGLGWDPDRPVVDILREYARYFISDALADDFAQGLLALERNWRGPLLTNRGVLTTLEQFRSMERSAPPATLQNWRFQQALYRAYYDAFVHHRLIYETELEQQAMQGSAARRVTGPLMAMQEAEEMLDGPS